MERHIFVAHRVIGLHMGEPVWIVVNALGLSVFIMNGMGQTKYACAVDVNGLMGNGCHLNLFAAVGEKASIV